MIQSDNYGDVIGRLLRQAYFDLGKKLSDANMIVVPGSVPRVVTNDEDNTFRIEVDAMPDPSSEGRFRAGVYDGQS